MASLPIPDLNHRPRALLVLNPAARKGTAPARFARVRPALEERLDLAVTETDPAGTWRAQVAQALARGTRLFIAAGGDGTVNLLINALEDQRGALPLSNLALGAVGLGSSNDFHKPARRGPAGIPMRVDACRMAPHDVVRVRYRADDDRVRARLFLLSASIGVVAAANRCFNRGAPHLRALDRIWPGAAIVYAAVHTLVGYHNLPAVVAFPEGERRVALTNLSVLKTPFLAGGFRYDTPIPPDDGRFAVNLCHGLSRAATFRLLVNLSRGHFAGSAGTRHWRASALEVGLDMVADLEIDGEVVQARHASFEVLEERIAVCA